MKKYIYLLITIGLSLTACQTKKGSSAQTEKSEEGVKRSNLTQKEAEARSRLISTVSYGLKVILTAENADHFTGEAVIGFTTNSDSDSLFVDFRSGAVISRVQLDQKDIQWKHEQGRLWLNQKVSQGTHSLTVAYKQKYSKDGTGLYRFKDPEDQRPYLYTQFETYDANHLFPCFDQPDLKARLTLEVTAPSDWQVITATRESAVKTDNMLKTWKFPATEVLSTYVFSLHAGPYHVWHSKTGEIPLRLFVRQSLKKYIRAEKDWFTPTRQGLAYFKNYFSYAYPFKKYDQIIVPDFNAGAMENAAAVTFSERFVQRGLYTLEFRESLANVILHEMAHMWFGDLVTMKWWNGLWLNESFATFMAFMANQEATEFKNSWMTFFLNTKSGAYFEDQLVTTHPVDSVIPDINSAFNNFDSITYGKGASSMKQLRYFLGADDFKKGVQDYFKNHAWTNTELGDFMGSLSKASGKNLDTWADLWLKTAGVETLTPEYTCEAGQVTAFALNVTAPDNTGHLPIADQLKGTRPHKMKLGLFKSAKNGFQEIKSLDVSYNSPQTQVLELIGSPCPDLVIPNKEDHDYIKVRYDKKTLATLMDQMNLIQDDLTRSQIWPSLNQMLLDAKIRASQYLKIVERQLPLEKNLKILLVILRGIDGGLHYLPKTTAAEKAAHLEASIRIENLLWTELIRKPAGSDEQKTFFDFYVGSIRSSEGLQRLVQLLKGEQTVKGLKIDQDQRWNMVIRLSVNAHPYAVEARKSESLKDPSEIGQQRALSSEVITPGSENKKQWLDKGLNSKDLSLARLKAIFFSLYPTQQRDDIWPYAETYYKNIPLLSKTRDADFLGLYTRSLMPLVCTQASSDRLREFMNKNSQLLPLVSKAMRIGLQQNDRCVKSRSLTQDL